MNLFVGLFVVVLAINVSIAVPVRDPSDDAEFIDIPKQNPRSRFNDKGNEDDDNHPIYTGYKGVVDTGAGYPFLQPLPHPLSYNLGFFDSFEDIFRRLRTQFWPIPIPDSSSEEDDFSLKIDPAKGGNTTSVVKVVDGHKIEINDTVYSNSDKNSGSVIKFRIINIRPLDDSSEKSTVSEDSTPTSTHVPSIRNPVTSAPNKPFNSNEDGDIDDNKNNDSDERKESMEDNKPLNNEIQGNLDDPEVKIKKNN